MSPLGSEYDQIQSASTIDLFKAYGDLGTDDKLALLYYVYEKMGGSITPAAPEATDLNLVEPLAQSIYGQSHEEQLNVMREIVDRADTPASRTYGGLTPNNQLLTWYVWAEEMGRRVVDMPNGYEATDAVRQLLNKIEGLEFQEQISLLREAASQMGYSEVGPAPTQAETGVTPSL
ncbi:MAG TPA: orange carotenoid protein N-terminal domain-containing protein [Trichocoleus sp.]